jgi:hypothetical protein
MTTPITHTRLRQHVLAHEGDVRGLTYIPGESSAELALALIDTAEAAIAADNYAKRHGLRFNDRLRETLNHYVHTP